MLFFGLNKSRELKELSRDAMEISSLTALLFFFSRLIMKAIFEYFFTVTFSIVFTAVGEDRDGSESEIELQHNDDMSVLICRLLGGCVTMICSILSMA